MEEAAFLVAVQRIVGGIEIQNDLFGWRLVRLEEEIDEQTFDLCRVVPDLVVAARHHRRVLEPVQGALAGERRTTLALGSELAGQRREHRVVAQVIMVDQIFVAERDAEHPLRHHRLDRVLDLRLGPAVLEAGGEPCDQADRPIGRAEQQRPGIRGGLAAVKRGLDSTALNRCKPEQVSATLCRHRGAPLHGDKALSQKNYCRFRAPMHLLPVRNPG
jgi:hypothetical protein